MAHGHEEAASTRLTEVEACNRFGLVSNVEYTVKFELVKGATTYSARYSAAFDYKGGDMLFLDFTGAEIRRFAINGNEQAAKWAAERIQFEAGALTVGRNVVDIDYTNNYDTTGAGFHRFVDPEDQAEYMYTNFEPFDCHRWIPCFDQPDLKATLSMTVSAPVEWNVFANSPAVTSTEKDGLREQIFSKTPRISTYLFALIVGPLVKYTREHNGISLGIACRKSMQQFLEPDLDELYTLTTAGLDWYGEYFDCKYPFEKYDQIFVPEFNHGAMENVGAVTFSEHHIYRETPTDARRCSRADTLLHEMAHMWFGNLVTMKWWNGLWLNESFATYMAAVAVNSCSRFKQSWLQFNSGMKAWAYRTDQLSTTHSINGAVADTDQTFLNFDGITYGKGAATLKQLAARAGHDGFRRGIQLYFARHAWGNTTLQDFLSAVEEGAKTPLGEWSRVWLEVAGLNTLTSEWTVADGKIASFAITQTAPADHPQMRPHTLFVATYGENGQPIEAEPLRVDVDGARTEVPSLIGRPAPAFVFFNAGDHAYAKMVLDRVSIDFLRNHVERIADPLTRQMIWRSLYDMVRDANGLKSQDYLAIISNKIGTETEKELVKAILNTAAMTLSGFLPTWEITVQQAHSLFETAVASLKRATESDMRIEWANCAISSAKSPADVATLVAMINDSGVAGWSFDQKMRWNIAIKATAFGVDGAASLVAAEGARDGSDRGKLMLETAASAAPRAEVKAAAWERISNDKTISLHTANAAMEGFGYQHQAAILEPFADKFFEVARDVAKARKDVNFIQHWTHFMFPSWRVNEDTIARGRALHAQLGEDDKVLARSLAECLDDMVRALKVRTYAASA